MNKEKVELLKKVDELPKSTCDDAWIPYREAVIVDVAAKIKEAHEITARMRQIAGELGEILSPEELMALKIPIIGKPQFTKGKPQQKSSLEEDRLVQRLLRNVTASFTGRRPKDLWGYEPKRGEYDALTKITAEHVESLVLAGYRRFISGGAQGFDQVAFDAVEIVRKKYPELEIQNILYLPCRGQESRWAKSGLFGQEAYRRMLDAATEVVYVHDRPYESPKDMIDRNHAMNGASSRCIAFWPDELDWHTTMKSGTAECMRDALKKGLIIDTITPQEVEWELEPSSDVER